MTFVIFVVTTAVVLGSALGVLLARNPVHCALSLVTTLVGVAIYFLMQNAVLAATVQIIVYASAIVVLFLFVIMLLGVDHVEVFDDRHSSGGWNRTFQRPIAIGLAAILFLGIVIIAGTHWVSGESRVSGSIESRTQPNIERIAETLFTSYVWVFELTAVLLTIAVVGAVVLARRDRPVEVEQ